LGGGRVAAIEILVNTKAVANLIREGKTFQIPSAMQTGKREGMVTHESCIEKLIAEGKIDKKVGMEFLGKAEAPHAAAAAPAAPTPGAAPKPPGGSLADRFKKSS
jgi:twitching motility protein PilT